MTRDAPRQGEDMADGVAGLWPAADYDRQVERLRAAVGETIYIAELRETSVQLGLRLTDHAFELLGVVDFPRPDPARGLAPHLILLDDGRGLNLGRIARISRRPFQPAMDEVLYRDREAERSLLFAERRLSKEFIDQRAQAALGQLLGHGEPGPPPQAAPSRGQLPDGAGTAEAGLEDPDAR